MGLLLSISKNYCKKKATRVIDGVGDLLYEYPFVVPIVREPLLTRSCTGNVIHPRFVLTAAHCAFQFHKMIVVYGDLTSHDNITISIVRKALKHPSYQKLEPKDSTVVSLKNDIAVLYVETNIMLKEYATVSPIDYHTLVGRPVTFLGAGGTYSHEDYHQAPQKVIIVFGRDQIRPVQIGKAVVIPCRGENQRFYPMLCMRSRCKNKTQTVQGGDSGGPVLYKKSLVGVCTGVQNDFGTYEAMYTPVSPFLSWIVYAMDFLYPEWKKNESLNTL